MRFNSFLQLPYPSCPLNHSLNRTVMMSPDEKGGSLVCLACYVFKAANLLGVQYPFGLDLDFLALFLDCIC